MIKYPTSPDLSKFQAKSGREARFGLPVDVHYCKKCVISNQRPNSSMEFKAKRSDAKKTIFLIKTVFVTHVKLPKLKIA